MKYRHLLTLILMLVLFSSLYAFGAEFATSVYRSVWEKGKRKDWVFDNNTIQTHHKTPDWFEEKEGYDTLIFKNNKSLFQLSMNWGRKRVKQSTSENAAYVLCDPDCFESWFAYSINMGDQLVSNHRIGAPLFISLLHAGSQPWIDSLVGVHWLSKRQILVVQLRLIDSHSYEATQVLAGLNAKGELLFTSRLHSDWKSYRIDPKEENLLVGNDRINLLNLQVVPQSNQYLVDAGFIGKDYRYVIDHAYAGEAQDTLRTRWFDNHQNQVAQLHFHKGENGGGSSTHVDTFLQNRVWIRLDQTNRVIIEFDTRDSSTFVTSLDSLPKSTSFTVGESRPSFILSSPNPVEKWVRLSRRNWYSLVEKEDI